MKKFSLLLILLTALVTAAIAGDGGPVPCCAPGHTCPCQDPLGPIHSGK